MPLCQRKGRGHRVPSLLLTIWERYDRQKPRPPQKFQVLPRRWVAERPVAWISHNLRLCKDYERPCSTGGAFVYVAMT